MAYNRLSDTGEVVLGFGSSATDATAIPRVFGGPGSSINISIYNRGGTYVPDTDLNTSIPATIGIGNPVNWSDYYTTTNWNPSFPDPKPPARNALPISRPPTFPSQPTGGDSVSPTTPTGQANIRLNPRMNTDVGDTFSFGDVQQPKGMIAVPYTVTTLMIGNITVPNVATGTNVAFGVTAEMPYDNPADVTVTFNDGTQKTFPMYFVRNPLNAHLQGTLSSNSAATGQQVIITGIRNVQMGVTVTIGGVAQTVTNVMPVINPIGSKVTFTITFTVAATTPTTDNRIIMTNPIGDKDYLTTPGTDTPILFKRSTQLPPSDRGGPPTITWTANEGVNEHLLFDFSSDYTVNTSGYPGAPYTVTSIQNNTTIALDPNGGYGNQRSLPTNDDYQLVENTTSLTVNGLISLKYVRVGTITSGAVVVPMGTAKNTAFIATIRFKADARGSASYVGALTTVGTGWVPTQSSNSTLTSSFGDFTLSGNGIITFDPVSEENIMTVTWIVPNADITFATTILGAKAPIYAAFARSGFSNVSLTDGTAFPFDGTKFYYSTFLGVPLGSPAVGFYPFASTKVVDATTGNTAYTVGAFYGAEIPNQTAMSPGTYFVYNRIDPVAGQPTNQPSAFGCWNTPTPRGSPVLSYNTVSALVNSGTTFTGQTVEIGMYTCTVNGKTFIANITVQANISEQVFIGGNAYTPYDTIFNRTSMHRKFYNWNGTVAMFAFIDNGAVTTFDLFDLSGGGSGVSKISLTQTANIKVFIFDEKFIYIRRGEGTSPDTGNYLLTDSWSLVGPINLPTYAGYPVHFENVSKIAPTDPNSQFNISGLGYGSTQIGHLTDAFLGPTTNVSYTFDRPASDSYTAITALKIAPNGANLATIVNNFRDTLESIWDNPISPTSTITTDAMGNVRLDFNTNQVVTSGSTFVTNTSSDTGTLNFTTTGGGSTSTTNFTRLKITGVTGNVFIDNATYGYAGSGSITFSHDADSFNSNSKVETNPVPPSGIRSIYIK